MSWEREEWLAARDEQDFGPDLPTPDEYSPADSPYIYRGTDVPDPFRPTLLPCCTDTPCTCDVPF